jgi:glycosyltransferase involved in cell wall biosynthesis
MKIAIDISMAMSETAGVGAYTRGLIDGLAMVNAENEYVLYSYLNDPESFRFDHPLPPNFSIQTLKVEEGHWERQWFAAELPPKEALEGVDIIHSPSFNAPQEHQGGIVVTIHDLSFLLFPQFHTETNRLHCFNGTLKAAQYADRIIVTSHQAKQDLMSYFAVPEERLRVVYAAPRRCCYPERNRDFLRSRLDRLEMYHNFILCMGSFEPRESLKRLIEAYAMYAKNHSGREVLVIAGAKGWSNEDIAQEIAALGVQERVKFLGWISEDDRRVLYSTAKLCVYPSLYEGFGLPPLEAMACGAPVVTSNTSALREVVGNAAILIEPDNSAELCQAILRVLSHEGLRLEMRQRSLERATLFSWERAAKETLAVYEEACQERDHADLASSIRRKIQPL